MPLGACSRSPPTCRSQLLLPRLVSSRDPAEDQHRYVRQDGRSGAVQDTPPLDSKKPPRYSGGVRVGPPAGWLFSPEYADAATARLRVDFSVRQLACPRTPSTATSGRSRCLPATSTARRSCSAPTRYGPINCIWYTNESWVGAASIKRSAPSTSCTSRRSARTGTSSPSRSPSSPRRCRWC